MLPRPRLRRRLHDGVDGEASRKHWTLRAAPPEHSEARVAVHTSTHMQNHHRHHHVTLCKQSVLVLGRRYQLSVKAHCFMEGLASQTQDGGSSNNKPTPSERQSCHDARRTHDTPSRHPPHPRLSPVPSFSQNTLFLPQPQPQRRRPHREQPLHPPRLHLQRREHLRLSHLPPQSAAPLRRSRPQAGRLLQPRW